MKQRSVANYSAVLLAAVLLATPLLLAQGTQQPVQITVDAREAARGILHAELTFPVQPGPLTLLYPKWIPGNHAPTGPVGDLVGLKVRAGSQVLTWQRDPLDMYAFQVTVPPAARSITVTLDSVSTVSSAQVTVLNWIRVLLYPKGAIADELRYAATLRLPPGWKYGTALRTEVELGDEIRFRAVSLTTLADSPVLAGAHFRTVDLDQTHQMHLAADSSSALEIAPELIEKYKRLVAETQYLFGAHHYDRYHFLVALSENIGWGGLEHHDSSDNRLPEKGLTEDAPRKIYADLLPHEFVHSWNGKYRRPAGLVRRDFNEPIETDMLWVYEGLTDYLGGVLAARSGLWTAEEFREALADTAAFLDNRPGRTWRPLGDTAVAAQTLRSAPVAWSSWRRGQDYYAESVLIWLEADVIIRQRSTGRFTLEDFLRRFHGGGSGPPSVQAFAFGDIVAGLSELIPYDWKGFFTDRLNSTSPHAPMGGVEASGWRLVYRETPSSLAKASEEVSKATDLRYSLGLSLGEGGVVRDIIPERPAAKAGMAPGHRITAVNGKRYSASSLKQVIKNAKAAGNPIELLVEDREFYKTFRLDYNDGERYAHLERDASRPDLLEQIIRSKAPPSQSSDP
jgi:predicted metalloprotease with PDZ domain